MIYKPKLKKIFALAILFCLCSCRTYCPAPSAEAYYNQGKAKYEHVHDTGIITPDYFEDMVKDFNEAITLNPNYADAYYLRAYAKMDIGEYSMEGGNYENGTKYYESAVEDLTKTLSINPNNAKAYCERALIKEVRLDDYKGAIEDYEKALSLKTQPSEKELQTWIDEIKAKMGNVDKERK